ncbi:MAG: sensor domain-containing diguanylate cyclase [Candidatus Omnitrophica bacterium]|nr:sensor domain-containing diguanylate cyclase [Candidatus Omnitrophota bacterium]
MAVAARLRAAVVRLTTRRYRRILIASLVTLGTSAVLLGLIGFIRWRGHQALQSDTHTVVAQASQQLIRSLQSRRGTLTFLRDTLNRQPGLTLPQLQALGTSAVRHTRHLLGAGVARASQRPTWWATPRTLSRSELAQLNRTILHHGQGSWTGRAPSTFVMTTRTQRPLLVMMEPLRAPPYRRSSVVGVFDLKPLLEDFFTANLSPRHPVQLLEGRTLLYRSPAWQPAAADQRPIIVESPAVIDAARWTMQMQPGSTRVAQTLSWLNLLLIGLCVIAGLGVTIIVWMLSIRTWILRRAVARRTAALRRTLARVRQLAITDELTGLYNRRFFLNRWGWEYVRAKRYHRPLACLMVDVNGFKQVNDRLGHQTGDLVLQQAAQEMKSLLRQSDILARFGGDEFVVALLETSLTQAELVAEKLRQISIPASAGSKRTTRAPTTSWKPRINRSMNGSAV